MKQPDDSSDESVGANFSTYAAKPPGRSSLRGATTCLPHAGDSGTKCHNQSLIVPRQDGVAAAERFSDEESRPALARGPPGCCWHRRSISRSTVCLHPHRLARFLETRQPVSRGRLVQSPWILRSIMEKWTSADEEQHRCRSSSIQRRDLPRNGRAATSFPRHRAPCQSVHLPARQTSCRGWRVAHSPGLRPNGAVIPSR